MGFAKHSVVALLAKRELRDLPDTGSTRASEMGLILEGERGCELIGEGEEEDRNKRQPSFSQLRKKTIGG